MRQKSKRQQNRTRSSRAPKSRASRDAIRGNALEVFDGLCREILETQGREVLAAGDPLAAEMWASQLLALFGAFPLIGEPEPADAVGGRLVSAARRRRTPEAQMCLRALAAVGSDRLAVHARRALTGLGPVVSWAPRWLEGIGAAEPTSAWRGTDPCGDQDGIMIGFRYPDGREHCLVVLVDHLLGGIAKDAAALPTSIEDVLATWKEDAGLELVEEPVGQAAGRVMEAVEWTWRTLDPPVTDDFVDTVALVRARLGSLADALPEPRLLGAAEREALVKAFLADDAGSLLTHDPDAWFLLDAVVDYRCDRGGDPLRWSGGAAELFLLDWVPRKLSAPDTLLDRAPDVLRAWVPWAAAQAGLPGHLAADTLAVITELGTEPAEALRDRSRWGPAKRIAMAMLADDIDPTDETAIEGWLSARLDRDSRCLTAS